MRLKRKTRKNIKNLGQPKDWDSVVEHAQEFGIDVPSMDYKKIKKHAKKGSIFELENLVRESRKQVAYALIEEGRIQEAYRVAGFEDGVEFAQKLQKNLAYVLGEELEPTEETHKMIIQRFCNGGGVVGDLNPDTEYFSHLFKILTTYK